MKNITGKQLFKIIYIVLCVIAWVFLLCTAIATNDAAVEDDIWGHSLDFTISGLISLIIVLIQLGLYHSIVYLIFEPQKQVWKVIINATILTTAALISVGLIAIFVTIVYSVR